MNSLQRIEKNFSRRNLQPKPYHEFEFRIFYPIKVASS